MRTNSDFFNEFNTAAQKELRLVIVIDFPTPLYLTSHAGIPNIPAGQIDDVVQDVSSISQRLNPDQGRSEIGSLSFSLIDKASAITDRFRSEQAAGEGLKGRKVELYRGGANIAGGVDTDWSEFRVEQTVQIESAVTYEKGTYKISCSDIQREMRRDIFDLAKTRLRSSFLTGATTIDVFSTDDFEPCSHVASFGEQPTGSFFYFKIKYQNGFEIVRATGKTGGGTPTFTGCVRGRFGTSPVNHILTAETGPTTGIEIEEYVYLELPAPAMAVALLTGNIPGGGTLPSRWNLGIPAAFINQSSFDDIGIDWFDLADYTKGLIFRFQSIKKTDGKRFIEREVCLLAGAFLLIGGDGRISMRRMTGVISTADFVLEIGVDNAIAHGPMKHDLSKVRNLYDIEWSYLEFPGESKPRFIRRDILVDANSIGLHGEAKPLPLQFKGLHNDRHTFTTLINRFDALRDRYAGPPLTMRVDLMPHLNDLEVGDIVRCVFPNVRDFTGSDTLDRSFEIQRLAINQKTGRVTAELFGSSLKADPIADEDAGATSELPNGWYDSEGTAADATLSIDGSGFLLSSGSLIGGTTTRTIFYVLGNFTIPSGLSVSISGNVELRVRGLLQINGTLGSIGGGMPANTAGFIGTTFGGQGVLVRGPTPGVFNAQRVIGQNSAMPVIEIENNAGVLVGIPPDMRGSGGGTGGDALVWEPNQYLPDNLGGAGGAGGPSIVTVSRGVAYGVSGRTNVGGSPGSVGTSFLSTTSGSGGGGAPGAMMHLLDGNAVLFPILAGNILAGYGTSPITNGIDRTQGKAKASDPISLGVSNGRVAYVPDSRDPYPEFINDEINDGDGNSIIVAAAYLRKATAPATPIADDGQYDFSTNTLTPPSIGGGSADNWSVTVPAGSDPLYVVQGTFEIQGVSGIDATVVWTTPVILASDGADGADGAVGGDGNSVHVGQVFLRKVSVPTTPIANDGQYNFTTTTLTPPSIGGGSADNWSIDVPAGSDPLYVSAGTFEINGITGIDTTVIWSAPVVLASDGADGADGADGGEGNFRDIKFQRNTAVPATPTGDNPSGWVDQVPAGTDALWQITGTKTSLGVLIGVWSTPSLVQGMTFRGSYSAAVAYILHDVVTFNGRTYINVSAGTGNDPTGTNAANAFWDLIAAKGDTGDPPTPFVETIVVPVNSGPQNLRALADAHTPAYDGIADATVTFTIASGGVVQGNAGSGAGIDTGSWPSAAVIDLDLTNQGTIRGGGGNGGAGGGGPGASSGANGQSGRDAVTAQEDLDIANTGGVIQAGGGAGGGGGGRAETSGEFSWWGGGGGGGGYPNGGGGPGGSGETAPKNGAAGSAGTTGGGGSGGGGGGTAGNGGGGGGVAANGSNGSAATGSGNLGSGGGGGAAGFAVRKNGHTVNTTGGTVTGTQG